MILPSIRLDSEVLTRFEDAIQQEWLVTNGLGSYASSTVLGINTRKYHGLLVAAFHPPRDRRVCLAKLDEEVSIGNSVYALGANEFRDVVFPQGHTFLKEFSISPFPEYVYIVQDVCLRKTVFMPYKRNAVIALYTVLNKNSSPVKIRVFPLINWRHFHSVTDRWKISWDFFQKHEDTTAGVQIGSSSSMLAMRTTSGHYSPTGNWIEKIYFREEAKRGESCLDDCYQPGRFEIDVNGNGNVDFALIIAAGENEVDARKLAEMPATIGDVRSLHEREINRQKDLLTTFYGAKKSFFAEEWLKWLVLAADTFIVEGANREQNIVIAGYPWFEAWGRDTFISLPGLMLVPSRFEEARKTLLAFKEYCRDGLIPNFVSDVAGQGSYNTVDATLWFVNSVLQYLKYTGDFAFVREQLWEALKSIVESHERGTAFGIRVDCDGLLSHGAQLTWMDAFVDGQPVTPRAGKAVEIQALWYNAVKTVELLAKSFKDASEQEKCAVMAEKARKSFVEKFWNAEKGCLFDVVSQDGKDASIRPNQVIAASLDFTMLDNTKNEKILDLVQRELLTPCGLRTVARNDPRYIGVYAGDRRSRDKAYHNGTVWPWLLGPFATAYVKSTGYAEHKRKYALNNFLLPLFSEQIYRAGLGTISEVFDGDPPHAPRGCIAQAWSVAEPLRAYVEDVMQIRPKFEREIMQVLE